jgi:hypothetical protein
VHFPWFSLPSAPRGRAARRRVWDPVRHAPPRNIAVWPYVRVDRIAPQFFPSLSKLSQVSTLSLRIESGFPLRRRESYSLRSGIFPQSPQDQPGDWRSLVGLVVIKVKKNIANESTARSAIGHFGQEVRKIEPSPDVSDKRFAHGNRFTDCVVANQIAVLLKGRLRSG